MLIHIVITVLIIIKEDLVVLKRPGRPELTLTSEITEEYSNHHHCWPYTCTPGRQNHTYCTPTSGRLESVLLKSRTNITNWRNRLNTNLSAKPMYKALFQDVKYYHKLAEVGIFSDLLDIEWFSLNSTHLSNLSQVTLPMRTNLLDLEQTIQMRLLQFDRQYNYTLDIIKSYDYYMMQVRVLESLLLQSMDQSEVMTDQSTSIQVYKKMSERSDRATKAEQSQLCLQKILSRHAQTL